MSHVKFVNLEVAILKVTLDRFEDGMAVLLIRNDETIKIDFPAYLLPQDSKEGDILDITIHRDLESSQASKERVSSLIDKLKNKNRKP